MIRRVRQLLTLAFMYALAFACLALSETALAECNPVDDPCAPKKDPAAWDKSLSLGFNLTQGNSDTTLFNLGGKAARDYQNDIWDFGFAYSYGEDDAREEAGEDKTNKNDFRGNASYSYLLTDRLFLGFGTKYLYDEIADIDYRVNLEPTVGYYFLKDNSFKFRIEGGPGYIFEKAGGVDDDYFAPRIADRFEWAITCTSKMFQAAEVIFDISDSDNYIVNAEAGVEAALTTALALVFSVRETYDNQPAAGREKDDLAVITALKVAL